MKAEERHRLKQNLFAEWVKHLPEEWHEHGSKILTYVLVAVVVIGAVWWFIAHRKAGAQQRDMRVQSDSVQLEFAQLLAAQQAQAGLDPEAEQLPPQPYDVGAVAASLASVADEAAGKATGMLALMKQAGAIHSQLIFGNTVTSAAERESICSEASGRYEKLLADYPDKPAALGTGKVGLALVAEELGQWDRAVELYEEVVALGEDKLAGSSFVPLAQRRLGMIDELRAPIEFPEPAPVMMSAPMGDAGMIDMGGGPEVVAVPAAASEGAVEVETTE